MISTYGDAGWSYMTNMRMRTENQITINSKCDGKTLSYLICDANAQMNLFRK